MVAALGAQLRPLPQDFAQARWKWPSRAMAAAAAYWLSAFLASPLACRARASVSMAANWTTWLPDCSARSRPARERDRLGFFAGGERHARLGIENGRQVALIAGLELAAPSPASSLARATLPVAR